MDVGVRELKQHLSEYLDRAARGEVIRVTERGQPKALLGPVPGAANLALGVKDGWIRRPVEAPPAPGNPVAGLRTVADALDEDRNG